MSTTQHPTVADVHAALRDIAPNELAQSWDSNTLICGLPEQPVRRVLCAVDPVAEVVQEAVDTGADMLITHHPLYLRGTDTVAADTPKGRLIHTLISNGIALANAHTSWDSQHGGVAAALAQAVGLTDTQPLEADDQDPTVGIGRVGTLAQPMTLEAFAQQVAAALPDSTPGLLVAGDLSDTIECVAVSGGAGDTLLDAARRSGADVFLTADLRHHPSSEHVAGGKPYLLCGTHYATEWLGLPPLAQALTDLLAERGYSVDVDVSTIVTDPWTARYSTATGRLN